VQVNNVVKAYTRLDGENERWFKIGLSNIAGKMPEAAYRHSTPETAARQYANVELIVRDNGPYDEKALANVDDSYS
jgi:hypothetical protein